MGSKTRGAGKLGGMSASAGVGEAVAVLRLMGHGERLKVLCHLAGDGELSVGQLLERIELSPSALSQHLARLRRHGLVATRKERQTVYYRVGRPDVHRLLETLHGLYCGT